MTQGLASPEATLPRLHDNAGGTREEPKGLGGSPLTKLRLAAAGPAQEAGIPLGGASAALMPLATAVARATLGRPAARLSPRAARRLVCLSSVAVDLLAALIAVLVAAPGRGLAVMVPLAVLAGAPLGVYGRADTLWRASALDGAPRVLEQGILFTLLLATAGGVAGPALLAACAVTVACGLAGRTALEALVGRASAPERCVFVGSAEAAERLRAKLNMTGRAAVVGRVTLEPTDALAAEGRDAAAVNVLRQTLAELAADRIVIEAGSRTAASVGELVGVGEAAGLSVTLLPRVLDGVAHALEPGDLDGLAILGVRRAGLSRPEAAAKRALDLVGATVLLAIAAPACALIALLIRIDSPGGVLYRQTRIGRHGRPFTMVKFRTMVDGADALKASLRSLNEAEGLFKIAADPRITRVGAPLRRLSLDELPQLINVIRGEMSLVGPRPLVPEDDAQITGVHRRRLVVTPGLTGRWQVLGSARIPLAEMVKLDLLYVTRWSLLTDISILLRTVGFVIGRRGL